MMTRPVAPTRWSHAQMIVLPAPTARPRIRPTRGMGVSSISRTRLHSAWKVSLRAVRSSARADALASATAVESAPFGGRGPARGTEQHSKRRGGDREEVDRLMVLHVAPGVGACHHALGINGHGEPFDRSARPVDDDPSARFILRAFGNIEMIAVDQQRVTNLRLPGQYDERLLRSLRSRCGRTVELVRNHLCPMRGNESTSPIVAEPQTGVPFTSSSASRARASRRWGPR
jgi:hypothetical protein